MNAIAAELQLAGDHVGDRFYRRWFQARGDRRALSARVARGHGVLGHLSRASSATFAANPRLAHPKVVNRFGSFFYDPSRVFMLAMIPRAKGRVRSSD